MRAPAVLRKAGQGHQQRDAAPHGVADLARPLRNGLLCGDVVGAGAVSFRESSISKDNARSYGHLLPEDLRRLSEIARQDREGLFHKYPRYRPLQNEIIAVALCQGAALHYVNGSNGIKDFDMWTFYAKRPTLTQYPPRRLTPHDFGDPRFGQSADFPQYVGRKVDCLWRSIPVGGDGLAALGRIAEYYALTLRSDRGYVGVLAYNPVHSDYATVYPRCEPYDLASWRERCRPTGDGRRGRRTSPRPRAQLLSVRGALQAGPGRLGRGRVDLGAHT